MSMVMVKSSTKRMNSSLNSTQILANQAASMSSKARRSRRKANTSTRMLAANSTREQAITGSHWGYSP